MTWWRLSAFWERNILLSKVKSFLGNFNERELAEIYIDNELLCKGEIKEVINHLDKDYTVVPESVILNEKYIYIKVK